jgi:hypothetical protein
LIPGRRRFGNEAAADERRETQKKTEELNELGASLKTGTQLIQFFCLFLRFSAVICGSSCLTDLQ